MRTTRRRPLWIEYAAALVIFRRIACEIWSLRSVFGSPSPHRTTRSGFVVVDAGGRAFTDSESGEIHIFPTLAAAEASRMPGDRIVPRPPELRDQP